LKVYEQSQDFFELQTTEPPSDRARFARTSNRQQQRGSLFAGLFDQERVN